MYRVTPDAYTDQVNLLEKLLVPLLAAAQAAPIFVLNSLDADVSVIDPVTWRVVKRIPTGKEPHHLYMTPDERSIIVANALGDSIVFGNDGAEIYCLRAADGKEVWRCRGLGDLVYTNPVVGNGVIVPPGTSKEATVTCPAVPGSRWARR